MAAAPQPVRPPDKASPAAPAKKKGGGSRPDMATIGGIVLAMVGIIGGLILEKGSIQDVSQATAALIVLGGTFGAVLVTTPMSVFLRGFAALKQVFFEQTSSIPE